MTFAVREQEHRKFCSQVSNFIEDEGFTVIPFGVENFMSKAHHLLLLELMGDDVSLFLRYLPDTIIVGKKHAYFYEVKSPSLKYDNIAIELDAKKVYWQCSVNHLPTFLVVRDMLACWATDIRFKKVFNNGTDLKRNNGSSTPYGLLNEELTKLIPLKDFLNTLDI